MIISPPSGSQAIVDSEGRMQPAFRTFTVKVAKLGIFIGTGSPENVVAAEQGQEYMDDAGVAGAIKYVKRDADIGGDTTKGWVLV